MKVFGSKTAGNQKIAESLDYEPVQNKLFLEKMKEGRGEKKIYGWVFFPCCPGDNAVA